MPSLMTTTHFRLDPLELKDSHAYFWFWTLINIQIARTQHGRQSVSHIKKSFSKQMS